MCMCVQVFEPKGEDPLFIELWDVGGANQQAGTRALFYRGDVAGVILVHDTGNARSYEHLRRWQRQWQQQPGGASATSPTGNRWAGFRVGEPAYAWANLCCTWFLSLVSPRSAHALER